MNQQLEKELIRDYPDRMSRQKTIPTFHPEAIAEAAEIFRRAQAIGQKLFISGYGNHIEPSGQAFSDFLVMKSDRLNSVIHIAPKDFYVTVGAGFPLHEINRLIAADKLWFPFGDTSYPGSFGGAIGCGLTASDGDHTTPLNRTLLSVTAVLADGTIVRPGAITFKSVSGYDISHLFFNSWGTLGMVMELSFRVLPLAKRNESHRLTLLPPDRAAFATHCQSADPLGQLCRRIRDEFDPGGLLPLPPPKSL